MRSQVRGWASSLLFCTATVGASGTAASWPLYGDTTSNFECIESFEIKRLGNTREFPSRCCMVSAADGQIWWGRIMHKISTGQERLKTKQTFDLCRNGKQILLDESRVPSTVRKLYKDQEGSRSAGNNHCQRALSVESTRSGTLGTEHAPPSISS